jgi:hypothetical protein
VGSPKKSLTPAELFDFRLASLLGRTIEEMKGSLTQREYLGWQMYWTAEPWGPWRDNMHVAILAKEIRRPQVRSGTKIDLDQFMMRDPADRRVDNQNKVITFLSAVAVSKPRENA